MKPLHSPLAGHFGQPFYSLPGQPPCPGTVPAHPPKNGAGTLQRAKPQARCSLFPACGKPRQTAGFITPRALVRGGFSA
jgi:hypothetical protein